jgi:hypothetical protein
MADARTVEPTTALTLQSALSCMSPPSVWHTNPTVAAHPGAFIATVQARRMTDRLNSSPTLTFVIEYIHNLFT